MPPITVPSLTEAPTVPQKSMGSVLFDQYADPFVAWLAATFGPEINDIIDAINTITSGLDQATPIAAYNAGTTYDFPDVVAGSDGYSYRCVGTSVVGVDPTTDDGTNWLKLITPLASEAEALAGTEDQKAVSPVTALAMIRAMALPAPPSGVDATGSIFGMNLSKTDANEITVSPGVCLDSTLSVAIELSSATPVTIPSVANTVYHIFAVRLVSDGSKEVRCYTSEAAAASDTDIDAYRWVGWWKTNGSSECVNMTSVGDHYLGNKASDWAVSTSIGTSYTTVDHSSFIPESRVVEIGYGTRDGSADGFLFFSDDGTNVAGLVARVDIGEPDTGESAWGDGGKGGNHGSLVPYKANRQFKSHSGTIDLLIHAVRVRR